MAKRDRFWWEFEHEILDYYDGPLEVSWTDSQGVLRIASMMNDESLCLYMVGTVDASKLKMYLDDKISMRSFYLKHVDNYERMRLTRHGVDFEEWNQTDFEGSLPEDHRVYYSEYIEDPEST